MMAVTYSQIVAGLGVGLSIAAATIFSREDEKSERDSKSLNLFE
jgi:hypothetical protein